MPIAINVEADVKRTTRFLTEVQRRVVPRATNSALNKTGRNVITQVQRRISRKTGLKVKDVSKGLFFRRSNFRTLFFDIIGRGRAVTFRRFVRSSKRHPGAFAKAEGVTANPWRKTRVYAGTFIIYGKTHGKALVVKRRAAKGRKLKVLYGPSVRAEFGRPIMQRWIGLLARKRFAFNFPRELNHFLSRLKQ